MPTKLVIKGVEPGTPLAGAVADHFGGRLKQFHVKQQQNYTLSPTAIHRSHIEWSGGRATYINQGGQEYLTLEVDPQLLRELSQKKSVTPDWCIVNLHVDGRTHTPSVSQLAVTIDAETKIVTSSSMPFTHVAADGYGNGFDDGSKNPLIAYPDPATKTKTVSLGNVVISSLKVDLRALGAHSGVGYNLRGVMTSGEYVYQPDGTYSYDPPGYPYASSSVPEFVIATVFYTVYDLGPGGGPPRFVWVPPEAEFYDTPAGPYFTHGVDIRQHGLIVEHDNYVFYQILLSSGIQVGGPYSGAGVANYRGEYRESKLFYSIHPNYSFVFVSYPVTSFLTFQFYEPGAQFDNVLNTSTGVSYWGARNTPLGTIVGTRFSKNLVSTTYTNLTSDLFGRFQLPLIGRIAIDRATRSIAFKQV